MGCQLKSIMQHAGIKYDMDFVIYSWGLCMKTDMILRKLGKLLLKVTNFVQNSPIYLRCEPLFGENVYGLCRYNIHVNLKCPLKYCMKSMKILF